jgi:hypothetical protein
MDIVQKTMVQNIVYHRQNLLKLESHIYHNICFIVYNDLSYLKIFPCAYFKLT